MDSQEAIQRSKRAFGALDRLEGIKTRIPPYLRLLEEVALRSGAYHTGQPEELPGEKG